MLGKICPFMSQPIEITKWWEGEETKGAKLIEVECHGMDCQCYRREGPQSLTGFCGASHGSDCWKPETGRLDPENYFDKKELQMLDNLINERLLVVDRKRKYAHDEIVYSKLKLLKRKIERAINSWHEQEG